MKDALAHYGIIGMKWGVRRTPEQLGHRSKDEQKSFHKQVRTDEKEYRRLRRDVTAAQKNLKNRSLDNDRDVASVNEAEKSYKKAISKRMPLGKQKRIDRQAAIDSVEKELDRRMEKMERSEGKRRQAIDHAKRSVEKLDRFVNEMNEKYGSENVKQLKTKDVTTGALWWKKTRMEGGLKTGVNMANAPLIGRSISAKIINNMEKDEREQLMRERLSDYERKTYA